MRTTRLVAPAAAGLLAVAGLTGCGGGDDADATNGGPIAVKATDTVCEVGDTEIDAGQVTFKVTNTGSKVNEFYVYAAGDRVMGEVENIAPGLSRELRVELTAGTYETACKPGMSGRGIRGALKVSGTAATVAPDAALTQPPRATSGTCAARPPRC